MLRILMLWMVPIAFGLSLGGSLQAQAVPSNDRTERAYHLTVMGGFCPEESKAMESALEEAQQRLMAILLNQGIQISPIPELSWIEKNLVIQVRSEHRRFDEIGSTELVRFSLDLKVTPQLWRSLRKTENTFVAGLTFLLVFLGFLLSRLYYRLDDWSKGFLTRWLAVGVVLILAALGGIYLWLRS